MARPTRHSPAPRRPIAAAPPSPPADGASQAALARLLAAAEEGAESLREALGALTGEAATTLPGVIEALGRQASLAAARALQHLADAPQVAREVRKAARRELHRLRTQGVRVEAPAVVASVVAPPGATALAEAWATSYDPSGSRALWLRIERPTGDVMVILVVNEQRGLLDAVGRDATRKRFRQELGEARAETERADWIELPLEYTRQLVQEAAALNAASGAPLPPDFVRYRAAIGRPERPFERALIYEQISPADVRFNPQWLEESPRLLRERLAGWMFPPRALLPYLEEQARLRTSRVVLPGETQEQRVEQVNQKALDALLTPQARQGLKRRLEETAAILAHKGRLQDARLAVAAALAFEAPPRAATSSALILPYRPAPTGARNPFAEAMMAWSLQALAMLQQREGRPPGAASAAAALWTPESDEGEDLLDELEAWLPEEELGPDFEP